MPSEISADALTISLVLLAAVLHASWNALAKASSDPLVNIAVVAGTGGLCSLPLLFLSPFPESETWKWLALSAVVHYAYQLALVRMYQIGDLSQVYPIARGLAPVGVAVLAAVGAGEALTTIQVVGLVLASTAIMTLSGVWSRGASSGGAVGVAVLTAGLIGLYTFSDGQGVRSVDEPSIYIAWSFFLGSVPMVLTTLLVRGRTGWSALRGVAGQAVGGGLMATLGYATVLWAMSRTTMVGVASLRESSVLFAAILGAYYLDEPFGRRRTLSALVLVIGLVLIQMAGPNAGCG